MSRAEWTVLGLLLLVPGAILLGRYLRWLSDRQFHDSMEDNDDRR